MNSQELLDDYRFQCIGGMLCTGRKYWHLYSYDPRFENEYMRSVHLTIRRNDDEIARLEARLEAAIEKVKGIIA
jgi:L-2-hydroxyglutarate oxidase LhgO